MLNPLLTIPTTTSFAGMPDWRRYLPQGLYRMDVPGPGLAVR